MSFEDQEIRYIDYSALTLIASEGGRSIAGIYKGWWITIERVQDDYEDGGYHNEKREARVIELNPSLCAEPRTLYPAKDLSAYGVTFQDVADWIENTIIKGGANP
jgi:hypothetical protein|tara:strand:+ start:169 stop:483 length:315 start_codon:yes stop_codon:yes gene_type:complete